MRCPFCADENDRVVDTRPSKEGAAIRRRRECLSCKRRFTTYETVEEPVITVVKRDGRREPFDRRKLQSGLAISCQKRPVSDEQLEAVVAHIETSLRNRLKSEIDSLQLGELVMNELAELDEVAYIRFASVYRQFTESSQFVEELRRLSASRQTSKKKKKPPEEETPPLFS